MCVEGWGTVRHLEGRAVAASKAAQRGSQNERRNALSDWQKMGETKPECAMLPQCCSIARTRDKKFLMRSRANTARASYAPWVFRGKFLS